MRGLLGRKLTLTRVVIYYLASLFHLDLNQISQGFPNSFFQFLWRHCVRWTGADSGEEPQDLGETERVVGLWENFSWRETIDLKCKRAGVSAMKI